MSHVIVITGASSGIGEALAKRFAMPGNILGLIARNQPRLEAVADQCRVLGAEVTTGCVDVRDATAIEHWLLAFDTKNPVDLLIVNAGILRGALGVSHEPLDIVRAQIDTNLIGALNTTIPLVGRMEARGRGQIALMCSLAAFAPHPDWPGYCAVKSALLTYGRMLRERMRGSGVKINVIAPGWVTAPINEPFVMWRPFEVSPEVAAVRIARGLARNQSVIAFPWPLAASAWISGLFPAWLRRKGYRLFRATYRNSSPDASVDMTGRSGGTHLL
jgi:short-subunit dehydrogenase